MHIATSCCAQVTPDKTAVFSPIRHKRLPLHFYQHIQTPELIWSAFKGWWQTDFNLGVCRKVECMMSHSAAFVWPPWPMGKRLALTTEKCKLSQYEAVVLVTDTYLSCLEGFSRISRWNFESPHRTSLSTPSWQRERKKEVLLEDSSLCYYSICTKRTVVLKKCANVNVLYVDMCACKCVVQYVH